MINFGLMAEKVFDETQFNGVTGIILGSGLGKFADILNEKNIISYNDIAHYPKSTVEGHDGELVTGYFQDQEIIVGKGRFHFYEGYSFQEVVIPIHLFHELGVKNIIITNSSGSMNINFVPGSFMVIKSHMDCTYRYDSKDPKLFSGDPYHCPQMIDLALKSGKKLSLDLNVGTYCWTLGPSYETPAEILDMQRMGGDAVGMSTVPEIISAGELGMSILTLSCLTNFAAGISSTALSHEEVIKSAEMNSENFIELIKEILSELPKLN